MLVVIKIDNDMLVMVWMALSGDPPISEIPSRFPHLNFGKYIWASETEIQHKWYMVNHKKVHALCLIIHIQTLSNTICNQWIFAMNRMWNNSNLWNVFHRSDVYLQKVPLMLLSLVVECTEWITSWQPVKVRLNLVLIQLSRILIYHSKWQHSLIQCKLTHLSCI